MSSVGIIVVIVGLLASVAIHEVAHMLPAKRFGVPVTAYSVGFGPVLWKRQYGETEYRLSAIPLGGYVKIAGMYAPAKTGTPRFTRSGRVTLAEDARQESAQSIPPGREDNAFYLLPPWKKVVVMFAGPFSNLLVAALCLTVSTVGIGLPVPSPTIAGVVAQIETTQGMVSSPAQLMGIQAGDTIARVADRPIEQWSDISVALEGTNGGQTSLVVIRDGQEIPLSFTPVKGSGGHWVLGVEAGVDFQSASVWSVPTVMWQSMAGMGQVLVTFPFKVWEAGVSIVTGQERDPNGAISVVGAARVGGQMTASLSQEAPSSFIEQARPWMVVSSLLGLIAMMNMALFAFNMVPLPPLDGGHILCALYEAALGWVSRIRGGRAPQPVDTARLVPLTYTVGGLLLVSGLVLVVADIVNPIRLPM